MDKPNLNSDNYSTNKSTLYFHNDSFMNNFGIFTRALSNSMQFNTEFYNAFAEFYPVYFNTISEYNKSWKDLPELDKTLRSKFRKVFDEKFRQEKFLNALLES